MLFKQWDRSLNQKHLNIFFFFLTQHNLKDKCIIILSVEIIGFFSELNCVL